MLKKLFTIIISYVIMQTIPHAYAKEDKQIECIAINTYHEARGEGRNGMRAVSNVVMNRIKDPRKRFGTTPCEVVYQKTKGKCQFSWTCKNSVIRNRELFEKCKEVARNIYYRRVADNTSGATFYHSSAISGSWFKRNLTFTTSIGKHLFYR